MTETLTKDTTTKHPLPSGAVLHLGRPSFAAAGRLRNALARAASTRPLSTDEMKLGLSELKDNPSAGGALVSRMLSVLASEDVELAVFECLKQATYQPKGQDETVRLKVAPELFDHERFGDDARVDYYPICLKAGEAAVKPFLGALVSAFSGFLKTGGKAPGSKTT
jgi:hypothetical protein